MYVKNIMARVHTQHRDRVALEQTLHYTKESYNMGEGNLHKVYKNFFSLVDVADGYWYVSAESHIIKNWTSKMIISIMKFFINNMWCLYCSKKAQNLRVFRANMASVLAEWE